MTPLADISNVRCIGTPAEGYTLDHVARSVGVHRRTVEEWNGSGFLPTPIGTRFTGRRGRPRLLFPTEALAIATSLRRWRSLVGSAEEVKTWLWLEGHDYIAVDVRALEASITRWRQTQWQALQEWLPSLPPLGSISVNDDTTELLLEELDSAFTHELIRRLPERFVPAVLGIITSMIGLVSPEDLIAWQEIAERDGDEPILYLQGLVELLREISHEAIPPLPPQLGCDADFLELVPHLSRSVWSGDPDWDRARELWQRLCFATDVCLDEPTAPMEPAVRFLAALRRSFYKRGPVHALVPLVVVSQLLASCPPAQSEED